eukprot:12880419-Prorocentrum_lima.AAC.1
MMTRGFGRRKSKQHVSRTMASNFTLLPTIFFVHHLELGPVGSAAAATTPADANEASTTSTTSIKTVDEKLTAPKRTIRWETLLRGMPCDQFVQEVMWCNVTFHADHFLPATAMRTDSKERKEKLRKLRLDGMEEVAEGEEKHIFL